MEWATKNSLSSETLTPLRSQASRHSQRLRELHHRHSHRQGAHLARSSPVTLLQLLLVSYVVHTAPQPCRGPGFFRVEPQLERHVCPRTRIRLLLRPRLRVAVEFPSMALIQP